MSAQLSVIQGVICFKAEDAVLTVDMHLILACVFRQKHLSNNKTKIRKRASSLAPPPVFERKGVNIACVAGSYNVM